MWETLQTTASMGQYLQVRFCHLMLLPGSLQTRFGLTTTTTVSPSPKYFSFVVDACCLEAHVLVCSSAIASKPTVAWVKPAVG